MLWLRLLVLCCVDGIEHTVTTYQTLVGCESQHQQHQSTTTNKNVLYFGHDYDVIGERNLIQLCWTMGIVVCNSLAIWNHRGYNHSIGWSQYAESMQNITLSFVTFYVVYWRAIIIAMIMMETTCSRSLSERNRTQCWTVERKVFGLLLPCASCKVCCARTTWIIRQVNVRQRFFLISSTSRFPTYKNTSGRINNYYDYDAKYSWKLFEMHRWQCHFVRCCNWVDRISPVVGEGE